MEVVRFYTEPDVWFGGRVEPSQEPVFLFDADQDIGSLPWIKTSMHNRQMKFQ